MKKCTSCGVNLNDKRNRNLVAEALLTLFPKNENDEQTTITTNTEESSHGNTDEIITYKIICKELSVYLDQERRKNAMIKLTRNSYIEVISIIDDLDEKLALGNLKTGGWVILNDLKTGEIFANPLDIGVYQNQATNNQVNTKFNINSEMKGILDKDVFFDVVKVRYCSQNNLVRAELSTGSWVNLINGQTGEIYAKPLQLGAYVTNNINGAYFDIIEISHAPEIKRVRGNLPTGMTFIFISNERIIYSKMEFLNSCMILKGEWFSLVNTEEGKWAANPLQIGIYRTVVPSTKVYKGLEKGSEKLNTLNMDEIVHILLILSVPGSDMIRAKISSGGK